MGTFWRKIRQRLAWGCRSQTDSVLWLHGASLGECLVWLEVMRFLPPLPMVLTTQKAEIVGYLAQQVPGHVQVRLAPLATTSVMRRWFRCWNPWALVLCESEFWPAWLRMAQIHSIPVALISGRMTQKAWLRYRRWMPRFARWADVVQRAWFQNQVSMERYLSLGGQKRQGRLWRSHWSSRCSLSGDWKLLRWLGSGGKSPGQRRQEAVSGRLVLLSVHPQDWPFLKEGLAKYAEMGGEPILIPRYPQDGIWFQRQLQRMKVSWQVWPQVQKGCVTFVSGYGLIPQVLEQAELAVMGGSFCSVTTHNFWEPLAFGVPVLMGPFRGAHQDLLSELEDLGIVRSLYDLSELCIGVQAEKTWLPDWYPWKVSGQIPDYFSQNLDQVQNAMDEFRQWLLTQRS